MLFQFVSVLLLIGSDAAATELVKRKRSNLLQHKSTNNKQHQQQHGHDERYAAYIGLAEEDNVTNNRQLQNSMSMSIPAEVTSWTEEEADGPQHSDVMWTDPNEVAWKEDEDSGSADVIDDTSSGYIRLSYVSLCVVGLAALLI